MAKNYVIFGSEMSPYSVKVRSYFRYKGLAHQWIAHRPENDAEYRKFARLLIVPTVATPEGTGLQDSTPIIETLEAEFAEPAIHPEGPVLGFISALIEEFGDEWGNKLMFHHRWYAEVDRLASAQTLARLSSPSADSTMIADLTKSVLLRMAGRGHFVGSSEATAPLITDYYLKLIDILNPHLATRKYLLGARPSFGDFGLSAQLYEASVDPTCGAIMRARGPVVLDWCHRMLEPRLDGPFEEWVALEPTLTPLLAYIGKYFLPWSKANAAAVMAGADAFTVELAGQDYTQPPQKYHAKSLAALRSRYAATRNDTLDVILAVSGCVDVLKGDKGER